MSEDRPENWLSAENGWPEELATEQADQWLEHKFEMATNKAVYTAYALTSGGREEIDCYATAKEAVQDILEIWPEDDEGDVVIEGKEGLGVAYFARSDADPRIVHIYFMADNMSGIDHVESYRCEYTPAMGGAVRTNIRRLG